MRVECAVCKNVLNIPDERLPAGKEIAFPCPRCRGIIKLDLRPRTACDEDRKQDATGQDRLKGEALKEKILGSVRELPPMPQTVLKARDIMADSTSDFKALADLFETDQAIAAKILKLANSPYYGLSGKVSSIHHASVVLGHKALGELITMGGTSTLLAGRLEGYGLDAGSLWKHSLAVAFGSKIIADKKEPALSSDAFTAGLIHDSGKLILDQYIVERWDEVELFMSEGEHTFLNAEKSVLHLDHAEVAAAVCKNWNIPNNLAAAVRYHHAPSRSNGMKLAYIIHIADAIAMMTGLGLGIDGTFYRMDEDAMDFVGLAETDVSDIMESVLEAAQNIAG